MFLWPIDDELSREIQKPVYISYPGLKASFQISAYLGQLAAYLRILDDKVRKPHENQTIGLILCKSADKEYVEYIIQDYDKHEKLRRALPPVEYLKKLL